MSISMEIVCPGCGAKIEYQNYPEILKCLACDREFITRRDVLLLSQPQSSWNLISADLMQKINILAREKSWQEAVKSLCPPNFFPIAYEDGRADWKHLLNIDASSIVLDFGSGWGAISVSLAREGARVVALDKTIESLEFVKIRSSQEGFSNVLPICYQGNALPFPDNYFNSVILNGALEWLVNDQSYCTSKDSTHAKKINQNVSLRLNKQLEFIKEFHRVLNSDGCLYIGIENRIALKYFLSIPEDHMNLRFISLLPRKLADIICMLKTGRPYLARTYTKSGYKALLNKSGFKSVDFYMPVPDYRKFDNLIAADNYSTQEYFIKNYKGVSKWYFFYKLLYKLNVLNVFINSFSIFAFKNRQPLGKIFAPILDSLEIYKEEVRFCLKGRLGSRANISVIAFLKDKKKNPVYIKMNKDPRDGANIEKEYKALLSAAQFCDESMKGRILKPELFQLERGRKALVQKSSNGKNLADHFRGLSYNNQLPLAAKWLPELAEWLTKFHIKSTMLLSLSDPKVMKIISNRLCMAKKIDETMGTKLYHSVAKIISEIEGKEMSLPIGFIHGDFSPVNVLFENDSLYSIIDWEDSDSSECGLDDICNLFFSFGERLRPDNFENRFITVNLACKLLRKASKKFLKKRANNPKMQEIADYTFYSDIKLLPIMTQAWDHYSKEIGLRKEAINLWLPLYVVKYASLELMLARSSISKCQSWVNLFDKIQNDRFEF